MKYVKILSLMAASFTLCGCFDVDWAAWFFSEELSRTDIPGRYIVRHENVAEILELNPDGTFIQLMITDGSDTVISEGRWEFSEKGDLDYRLDFSSFRIQLPTWRREWLRISPADTGLIDFSCKIEKVQGKTRLWVAHELMFSYRKVQQESDNIAVPTDSTSI